MAGHTPGPWEQLLGEADEGHPIYQRGRVVVRIVPKRAPDETAFKRLALVDSERPVEDSRLIVAAPDLRSALQDLLALYDEERGVIDVSPEHTCPECTLGTVPNHLNKGPCAFHRARAAIAKATT